MKKIQTKTLCLIAIVLISMVGGILAVYGTVNGPWGFTDPVAYISTARSLANGQGVGYFEANAKFTAYTIQPPFYPIVLSILGLLKINLVAGARWLNILAFVASIFIAGWIILRYSRVPALGVIASILLCTFPYMVVMFSSAYSEPLFILLYLCGGWCLVDYFSHEKLPVLLTTALLIGMLPVTRYAGIAMVIAGGLSVLFFSSGKTWSRIKKAFLFVFVACLPILIWLAIVFFNTAHTIADRSLELNWGGLAAQFQTFRAIFMDTVWTWVPFQAATTPLRYMVRYIMLGIGLVIILILALLAERRLRKISADGEHEAGLPVFTFFGLSSLIFLGVLISTYLFTHPTIDIDNRMLLPFYVSVVMSLSGVGALWYFAWFKGRMRIFHIVPWLIAVVCVVWYFPQTRNKIEIYHSGFGLTAYHWNSSEIIQVVRALPPSQPVISNDWELLMLWTGRPIYGFWTTFPSEPPLQIQMYGNDTRDSTQSIFCRQGAALVIMNDFPTQFKDHFSESYANQSSSLFRGLTVYGVYSDGTLYLCR